MLSVIDPEFAKIYRLIYVKNEIGQYELDNFITAP
jgi:hypothetical protein